MQSNLLKLLTFIVLVTCLYFVLKGALPDNQKPAQTSEKAPQQIQINSKEKKALLHHTADSKSLLDYVDTCLEKTADSHSQLPQNVNLDTLKVEGSFFDVMSEPVLQGEGKLTKLMAFYRNQPADELVALEIIRLCAATPSLTACDSALFSNLTFSSSDALPWIYLASFHAARGNREKVLKAMDRAIQSDFYGNGFAERVSRLSDIIHQNTPESLYTAVVAALGIEASNSVFPTEIFSFCKASSSDLYTATLCHQLGQDMALRGRTLALAGAGQSLARMMQEVSEFHFPTHDNESSDAYESGDMQTIWPLMQYNDRLLLNWLTDLNAFGEKKAAREAIDSVRARMISDDFTHCAE